jgi:cytochrome c-type biogenesis protein
VTGNVALGYAAGILSTLSPCVLPILPLVLFGALERHALGPLALAAGLALAFAGVGIAIAAFGFALGVDQAMLRPIAAVLIAGMGLALLLPQAQSVVAGLAAPLAARGQTMLDRLAPSGLGGQFVLGALLGVIWSPCTGPTLGAAVGLAAQGENLGSASVTMVAFAMGAATPIVALAYGSRQAILSRRDQFAQLSRFAKPAIGVTFLTLGLFVLTGVDKMIETILTRAMPDWLLSLTTRL